MKSDFDGIKSAVGGELPGPYKDFLVRTGGTVVYGDLLFYALRESSKFPSILERNQTWEVAEYAPGFVAVADDGGGQIVIIQLSDPLAAPLMVEAGWLEPDTGEYIANSWAEWESRNFSLNKKQDVNFPKYIDVYIINMPHDGLIGLRRAVEPLKVDIPASKLLLVSKNIPYRIASNVPYAPWAWMVSEANSIRPCFRLSLPNQIHMIVFIPSQGTPKER